MTATLATPAHSALPEVIGRFRIVEVLASGGMGLVYRAVETSSGREVAIKTVSMLQRERLEAIRSEIIALTRLQHPGVVTILDHGVDRGMPWYAMDLIEGDSLAQTNETLWGATAPDSARTTATPERRAVLEPSPAPWLSPSRPPSLRRAKLPAGQGRLPEILTLYRRLCATLGFLHGRGIIHRDIKPSNVIVRPNGQPVLVDFGLFVRARGAVGREALETSGRLMGTAAYIAPEQIQREFVDARTDLYALGCMMYETVTGFLPFRAATVQELCRQHLEAVPLPPSELVDGVDPRLDELILRLLAKRKRDRTGHADDVATILAELGAEPEPSVRDGGATMAYLYRPEMSGRDDLLAELTARVDALSTRKGSAILLAGASGVGKTFVASEMARRAAIRGIRVVPGECIPAGIATTVPIEVKGAPLHPLRTLAQAVVDACNEGGREKQRRLIGERGPVLAPHFPLIGELPGVADQPAPPELSAEEVQRRLFEQLGATLHVFAADGPPVLLILDDLQWADELTLAFLSWLTRRPIEEHGLMLLGTYRPDEIGPALGVLLESPNVVMKSVGRLEDRYIGQVVADMLGVKAAPDSLVRYVTRQAEGNPFFAAEYLRGAATDRLLTRNRGTWSVGSGNDDALDSMSVPRSIQDLVGQRLLRLSPDSRDMLQRASVLGRDVDVNLLLAMGGFEEQNAISLLRDLASREILESTDLGRFRFAHDKLREITYRSIPPEGRRAMHKAAAVAMESSAGSTYVSLGALAHHWSQAQEATKAIDYFELAGYQALSSFSNREALTCLRSALALAGELDSAVPPTRLARWERGMVEAHVGLGEYAASVQHAESALSLCGTPLPRTQAGWVMALLWHTTQLVAGGTFRRVLRRRYAQNRDLYEIASSVLARMFEPFLFANRPLQATYCGLRNLTIAQHLPPIAAFARGYASMSIIAGMFPRLVPTARAWADRALEIARKSKNDEALIYALGRTSCFLLMIGDWRTMEPRLKEAEQIARRVGDRRGFEESLATDSERLFFEGAFLESRERAAQLHASGASRGDEQTQSWGDNIQVQALARLGRYEEALKIIQRMLKWLEQAPDLERMYAYGNFALVYTRAGNPAMGKHYADLALECLGRTRPAAYFVMNGLWGIAEAYFALAERMGPEKWKRDATANAQLRSACTTFLQFSRVMAFARPAALLCKGRRQVLSGKKAEGARTVRAALELAKNLRMPYEEACARYELGRLALDAGGDAHPHFDDAEAIFDRLGAATDVAYVKKSRAPLEAAS
jgi:serine/threonine protein kinase/tetratricopeptide (TPR) repeat protein